MAETPVLRRDGEAATLEPFPTGLNHSDGAHLRQDQAKTRRAYRGIRTRGLASIMAQMRPSPRTGIHPGSLCNESEQIG